MAGHILIVEDEAPLAETLAELLADEGYRAAVSADGAALAAAHADPPGLVLVDVLMPGMDGPELCRRLKADARTAGVPVLVMSALPPETLAERLGGCPHDGILRKPFLLDEVLAAVRRHLP